MTIIDNSKLYNAVDTPAKKATLTKYCVDSQTVQLLVLSYLLQNNYGATASAFARTTGLYILASNSPNTFPPYLLPQHSSSNPNPAQVIPINPAAIRADSEMHADTKPSTNAKLPDKNVFKASKKPPQFTKYFAQSHIINASLYDNFQSCNIIDIQIGLLCTRKEIVTSVLAGDITSAKHLLRQNFPEMYLFPKNSDRTDKMVQLLDWSDIPYIDSVKPMLEQPGLAFERNLKSVILRYFIDLHQFTELVSSSMFDSAAIFCSKVLCHYHALIKMWMDNLAIYEMRSQMPISLIFENKALFVEKVLKSNRVKIKDRKKIQNAKHNLDLENDSLKYKHSDYIDSISPTRNLQASKAMSTPLDTASTESLVYSNLCYPDGDDGTCGGLKFHIQNQNSNENNPGLKLAQLDELTNAYNHVRDSFNKNIELLALTSITHENATALSLFSRQKLVYILNNSILEHLGYPRKPALVSIVNQVTTLLKFMRLHSDKEVESTLDTILKSISNIASDTVVV